MRLGLARKIGGVAMSNEKIIERPCTIAESIALSLKEVKMMRNGEIPKRSWSDFVERMKQEEYGD